MGIKGRVCVFIFGAFLLLLWNPASAQFYYAQYRPSGLNWQQLKTEHFRIIFPAGEDSLAFRAARILESQYPFASEITGGSLQNFPVILKNYNDLANGFVTSLNFRSEIDLSPIKGKELNPATGGWLENVLPHELVHATHFNVQQDKREQKISFPNIVSYFSPDLARSVHGFVPNGLHEGLAVHYESNYVYPETGRSNLLYFQNRYNANFGSANRWNMAQQWFISDYTIPYGRHYIAGSTFMSWLHQNYGESISRELIRYQYQHFMFGFGIALKSKTGLWPKQLYALYEKDMERKEAERLSRIEYNTTQCSRLISTPYKGEQLRAPKWVNENELLFFGSFYNAESGFYSYNLNSQRLQKTSESTVVGDYNYEISGNHLLFGTYNGHAFVPGVYRSDVQKLNLDSGQKTMLTNNQRVYAPTAGGGRIFAIQSEGATGRIVELLEKEIRPVSHFTDAMPVHLKINPHQPEQIAVVLNKRGTQALWITTLKELPRIEEQLPAIAFKTGSIHDPEWHPDGEKLLFVLDAPPAMNVYEFDLNTRKVEQLTSALYNAFEASYSPSGAAIAYVIQDGDERKVAVLDSEDFLRKKVPAEMLLTGDELQTRLNRKLPGEDIAINKDWKIKPYRSDISWLKPRAVLPVFYDHAGSTQFGAGISSTDPLQRHSYYAELTGIQDRLWYQMQYANRMFYPGINLNVYSEPMFFVSTDPTTNQQMGMMRQDRGLRITAPFDLTLRNNSRYSSLYFEPRFTAEQFRYFDLQPTALSDFATRYKAGFFSQLSLNLKSYARNVQPAGGLVLFALAEQTLNRATGTINFRQGAQHFSFAEQWAAYYGMRFYAAPLKRLNQSLQVDVRFLHQSDSPIYSNSTIVPGGFKHNPFPDYIAGQSANRHLASLSTRYAIPLLYPDNGWITLPLYMRSVYLSLFSHTLTNLNAPDLLAYSRTIVGAGLHVQYKVSNLSFELGLGLAWEPSRQQTQFIFSHF